MAATILIHDETSSGQRTRSFNLDCLTEGLTVRELIRARIYQEVQDYNQKAPEYLRGLVEPTQAERTLNGYKLKAKRKIDWQEQFQCACEAFERNGFFVLVGDCNQRSSIRLGNSGQICEARNGRVALALKKFISPVSEQIQTSFAPASK